MKVQISTKSTRGKKKVNHEFGGEWSPHVEPFGFKIVEHAGGEEYGKTIRMQPAFDDFNVEGLFPRKERVKLKVPSYNLSKFGKDDTFYQAQDYHALFFYKKEKTNMLPKYMLVDSDGEAFGFYDHLSQDIYIHDFTHDTPQDDTIVMVNSLLNFLSEEFNLKKVATVVKKTTKVKIPIRFGMDPEFLFYSPLKQVCVSAQQILNGINSQMVREGVIGHDDHPFTGELRPKPASSPEELVKTLRTVFKELSWIAEESNLSILCGGGEGTRGSNGNSEPIGGHIHISKIVSTESLSSTMDTFIGKELKKMAGGKRPGDSYGRNSDCDEKSYGSDFGFEYRTPPSFITFPSIVLGALKIIQIVVERGQDDEDIPSTFSRGTLLSLARNDYETRILKRYYAFLKYGDLTSDPIENWLVKENLLTSKLTINDRTGTINIPNLKKMIVSRNKKVLISMKGRKHFVISRREDSSNSCYIPFDNRENIIQTISDRL